MSMFSNGLKKIGKGLKKVVTDPGKAVKELGRNVGGAAKIASKGAGFIPGVGPLAAAGLGAAGSVLSGGNMRDHLGAAAGGLASGLGGGALRKIGAPILNALPGGGMLSGAAHALGDRLGGIGLPGTDMDLGDLAGKAAGGLRRMGGAAAGKLGGALGGIDGTPGIGMDDLLAGAAGAEGVYNGVQAARMRGKMVGAAEDSYRERAPLRKMGIAGMQQTAAPDLSDVYQDEGNPYMKPLKRRGV